MNEELLEEAKKKKLVAGLVVLDITFLLENFDLLNFNTINVNYPATAKCCPHTRIMDSPTNRQWYLMNCFPPL